VKPPGLPQGIARLPCCAGHDWRGDVTHRGALTAESCERGAVAPCGQRRVEAGAVDEARDTARHGERAPHRRTEDRQGAAIGHRQPEQEAQKRGLPGTVGPDEAVDLSGVDVEVDAVEGDDVAEGLGETARQDRSGRFHGFSRPADETVEATEAVALDNCPDDEAKGPE